ncbi:MAG: 50S ribosomal protein L4 [Candidatus Omnitrophica bacterium]|nr:50S ribosomal protein L4 [Candidatus Omnitrophota bacterium]
MPKTTVLDQKGRIAGEIHLPVEIFYARVNARLLSQVSVMYSANQRRGTADTKTRREVRGGGKKPWRQKGTGRARHGSIRSPIWRGGGVVFGPHPKDYYVHIPVQLKRQALISALSMKNAQSKLTVVDSVRLARPKTNEWVHVLEALKLVDRNTLCVLTDPSEEVKRAAHNLGYCLRLKDVRDCSAYDVMNYDRLLIEKRAIPSLETRLLGGPSANAETDSESPKEKKGESK